MLQTISAAGFRCDKNGSAEMPSASDRDTCETLLRNIDEALNTAAGAMISERQFDEVTKLRSAIRGHCQAGRLAEARRLESRAIAIIRQTAPC